MAAAGAPKMTLESRKTQMKVVIVESPAKAKTINKYLGRDYRVLASCAFLAVLL